MREFIQTHVYPEAIVNDELGKPASKELYLKMGTFGLLACRLVYRTNKGPGPHLKGMVLPGGVKPEEFDYVMIF